MRTCLVTDSTSGAAGEQRDEASLRLSWDLIQKHRVNRAAGEQRAEASLRLSREMTFLVHFFVHKCRTTKTKKTKQQNNELPGERRDEAALSLALSLSLSLSAVSIPETGEVAGV